MLRPRQTVPLHLMLRLEVWTVRLKVLTTRPRYVFLKVLVFLLSFAPYQLQLSQFRPVPSDPVFPSAVPV